MKALLVQLPTSHLGAKEKVYPLGLSRLSSTIGSGVEKKTLDMNLEIDPWPLLHRTLIDFAPEVVAFSFRNIDPLAGQQASYLSSLKTATLLARKCIPAATIFAGGPAFSLFGARLMEECPEIDAGLVGEGELVFPMLLKENPVYADIPGILWRDTEGRLVANPPCRQSGLVVDLNRLPPLDLQSFDPGRYLAGNAYVAAMGIEGKRGCDLQCGYCLYPQLGGARMRLREPRLIVDEMELLHKEYGVGLFHFTDPVVNRPADHFAALTAELKKRGLPVLWTGFFREDLVSRENLAVAQDVGLCCVYFSGDALSSHGLKLLRKQMGPGDIVHAAQVTAELKLLTVCHFLVNLPGETDEGVAEADQLLDRLLAIHHPVGNLGAVIFNNVRLYPHAPLTRKLIEMGELPPETDLLYPTYYNPTRFSHVLHRFEARCHAASVFSRLEAAQ